MFRCALPAQEQPQMGNRTNLQKSPCVSSCLVSMRPPSNHLSFAHPCAKVSFATVRCPFSGKKKTGNLSPSHSLHRVVPARRRVISRDSAEVTSRYQLQAHTSCPETIPRLCDVVGSGRQGGLHRGVVCLCCASKNWPGVSKRSKI